MKHKSMKAYLFASGILDTGTTEEIAAAKKAYRRQYLREKKREYRKTRQTVTLFFTKSYAASLERQARAYKMTLPAFIKKCLHAYLEKIFIIPDEEQVQKLELLLLKIGTNVNQVTRLCHTNAITPDQAIESIYDQLKQLDNKVTQVLRKPQDIESFLGEAINTHPELLPKLLHILKALSHAHQDD